MDKEARRAYNKAYYQANRERLRESQGVYRKDYNKRPDILTKARERQREWRAAHPDRMAEWAAAGAGRWAAAGLEWRKSNRPLFLAVNALSRALSLGWSIPADCCRKSVLEETLPFYTEASRLSDETGTHHEVDHMIPLKAGGAHRACNLQVLTRDANRKKGVTDKLLVAAYRATKMQPHGEASG